MSYMTCPTCQTDDDVKVMHGSPPRLWVKCGRCRARWNVTVPDCGPGRHDWRDLTRTSSGRALEAAMQRVRDEPREPARLSPQDKRPGHRAGALCRSRSSWRDLRQ